MKRFVILALALAVATPVIAQNSGLRRLTDREDVSGWEGVGRLDLSGRGMCTGTLIAPDLVLTAAHCTFDRSTGHHYPAEDILFRAGYRDGKSVAERRVAQIETLAAFEPNGPVSPERIRVDVALLRLVKPIPTSVADPFVLHEGRVYGDKISVSSYGRGRAEAISRQRTCQIQWREQGLLAFDCNVTFGSSGSAILSRSGSRGRILSVVSAGGTTQDGKQIGYGMELPAVVSQLKQQMRSNAPRPAPRVRRIQAGTGRNGSGAKFIRPSGG
ncbi:MAG: trypsin-like peptidase domain-containing protein [Pseudomonadota bacterium]